MSIRQIYDRLVRRPPPMTSISIVSDVVDDDVGVVDDAVRVVDNDAEGGDEAPGKGCEVVY